MIPKAFLFGADAVVIDLEDSVPIADKEASREVVVAALGDAAAPPRYVRINARSTAWHAADLAAVVGSGLQGLILPKAESGEDVVALDKLARRAERAAGLPVGRIEVIPVAETALGVLRAYEIASSHPRVVALAFGAYDYAKDMNVPLSGSGEELLVPRTMIALAARAAGIQAVDTVYIDLVNAEGLLADCRRARVLGFSGKMCIHPSQIETVHSVFSPSIDEVTNARRIVDSFRKAEAEGRAAITVDGKLVDYPIAKQQERLLARAASLGLHHS
jgi:citrate lyase subunit beta / citryl-CoA lyase